MEDSHSVEEEDLPDQKASSTSPESEKQYSDAGTYASDSSHYTASETRRSKRKRPVKSTSPPRKRLYNQYNTDYIALLNNTIAEAKRWPKPPNTSSRELLTQQIGANIWTSNQKHIFFEALARLGHHDLNGIADAVDKSVPETVVFVNLLKRGIRSLPLRYAVPTSHAPVPILAEIPGASEIRMECEEALDRAAELLREKLDRRAEKAERERFGEDWLITQEIAFELEESATADETEDEEQPSVLESNGMDRTESLACAARLLKPTSWLNLSERVFMNPGPPHEEDNWFSISGPTDGKPSIFATAFTDFYNLTIIVTRRLVSAALFQANSRLRANDIHDWKEKKKAISVRHRDVMTALDILKMEPSSHEFWVAAARRNHLKVVDVEVRKERTESVSYRKHLGDPMDYEEVEKRLSMDNDGVHIDRNRHERTEATNPLSDTTKQDDQNSSQYTTNDEHRSNATSIIEDQQLPPQTSAIAGTYQLEPSPPNSESSMDFEDEEADEELDILDLRASQAEERRLWSIMHEKPRSPLPTLCPTSVEHRQRPQKQDSTHAADWTQHIDFRSEWERYGCIVPAQAFEKTQQSASAKWRGRERRRAERSSLRPAMTSVSPDVEIVDGEARSAQLSDPSDHDSGELGEEGDGDYFSEHSREDHIEEFDEPDVESKTKEEEEESEDKENGTSLQSPETQESEHTASRVELRRSSRKRVPENAAPPVEAMSLVSIDSGSEYDYVGE